VQIKTYHPSSGYTDEAVHLFAATGLHESDVAPDPGERIEIVRWPLADVDAAIAATNDAKTLIGLQWLRSTL
jgi:ADP-ribose pyrophosphatase